MSTKGSIQDLRKLFDIQDERKGFRSRIAATMAKHDYPVETLPRELEAIAKLVGVPDDQIRPGLPYDVIEQHAIVYASQRQADQRKQKPATPVDTSGWWTVGKAATETGINKGMISRAQGIIDNGLKRRERRLEPSSVGRWAASREREQKAKDDAQALADATAKAAEDQRRREDAARAARRRAAMR